MKRREDISLIEFTKFLLNLIISRIKNIFRLKKFKHKACIIIFPPALGLGDLIILSRIVDLVKIYLKFDKVKVAASAPWVDNKRDGVEYFNLKDTDQLVEGDLYIFPTYTFLNFIISHILNNKKSVGYKYMTPKTFLNKEEFYINDRRPYFERLGPLSKNFISGISLKPIIWSQQEINKRKLRSDYLSIEDLKLCINSKNYIISISVYNFYEKFRPNIKIIQDLLKQKKLELKRKISVIVIGSNKKKEIEYNRFVCQELKQYCEEIFNSSGLFSLDQSIDLLTQSNYYFGANNGISNIAQIIGLNCTQIFVGPEKPLVRKFSDKANIIYY